MNVDHNSRVETPLFRVLILFAAAAFPAANALAQSWPQGPGADGDFTGKHSHAPSRWSVSLDENIVWRTTLPETGQSSPVIAEGRVFITTMEPVTADAKIGANLIAWCFSAKDGTELWRRPIPGNYQTKLSGTFGDASSPAPVTDGKRVWFLNPTGRLVCYDLDGELQWAKEVTSVVRTHPVLFEGKLILHRQVYLPNEEGVFTHGNAKAPLEKWTQIQAVDAATGEQIWVSSCGANMGCLPLIQRLDDGTAILVVGRGGGHGPPEKPEGVSAISADNGKTLWTIELPKFMSTQTYPVVDGNALVFHKGDHLWIDARTGKIKRQVSIVTNVSVRRWTDEGRVSATETLAEQKPRSITQQSNLRVGNYHYFRCYTRNYLGRVDLKSGKVEYLELPLQILRTPGQAEQVVWNADQLPKREGGKKNKKSNPLFATLRDNSMKNSRGYTVMGDSRSTRNGWGHTASPVPTAFGNRLFVPIQSGIVFVIQPDAKVLDESAILAMNDLGPLGEAYTRASVTSDGERIYAHTIRELIAIGNK